MNRGSMGALWVASGALLFTAMVRADASEDCLSQEAARERVADLERQGTEARVERASCEQAVYRVFIFGDRDRQLVEEMRDRLTREGIVLADAGERGMASGAFSSEAEAEERLLDLLEYGFRSIQILREENPQGYRVVTPGDEKTDASDDGDGGESFTFGDQADDDDSEEEPASARDAVQWRVEDLRITTGYLPRDRQPVETYHDGTLSGSVRWQPTRRWEVRAGARFDAQAQTARSGVDDDPATTWGEADYTENWLRYRALWGRVTVGTQVVPWGTMDLLPPGDRLSAQDLTRGPLNPVGDRRRASPSLRLETYGPVDVDLLLTPVFRPAELPREGTLWHPVDQRRGRLLGVPDEPLVRDLVRAGTFEHDPRSEDEDAVGGVRVSQRGRSFDWGVTLQSARRSAPYYALSEQAREAALAGDIQAAADAEGATFSARHPRSLIVGGDIAADAGGVTWRFEGVWSSDEPATREDNLEYVTREGLDWAAGAEFFPGDANLRMSLQLTGQHLLDADDVIDPNTTYQLGGEIEQPWARETWRARLRFQLGLDRQDVYINPEIGWSVRDGSEIVLGGHYFKGTDDTLGGYFEDNRIITLGWRLDL